MTFEVPSNPDHSTAYLVITELYLTQVTITRPDPESCFWFVLRPVSSLWTCPGWCWPPSPGCPAHSPQAGGKGPSFLPGSSTAGSTWPLVLPHSVSIAFSSTSPAPELSGLQDFAASHDAVLLSDKGMWNSECWEHSPMEAIWSSARSWNLTASLQ